MERLSKLLDALITVGLGALAPALITAITSWWNRDAARAQLEAERLRQRDNDDPVT